MSDPTRQVCVRCNRRGWGFWSPDHVWDAVTGDIWRNSDICVFCFGELGDEKWIVWTEGLEVMPMSMRAQREFVETTAALDLLHDHIAKENPLDHDWQSDPDKRGEGLMCAICNLTEAEEAGVDE